MSRRTDRYYGVRAVRPLNHGGEIYRAGDELPPIGPIRAATLASAIEIPSEEIERVGPVEGAMLRARREAAQAQASAAEAEARGGPHLVWVHDRAAGRGGAERSNAELMRVGRDLGWRITHIHRDNASAVPAGADAYLVASTHAFSDGQLDTIERAVYASGAPIITREHDYGVCERRGQLPCGGAGDGCIEACQSARWRARMDRYRLRLERSSLAVWISQAQRDIHAGMLGEIWRREHLLPPPVDPDQMRPVEGVERDPKLAVCTAGILDERKGRSNVVRWAVDHPDWLLSVYVRDVAADALRGPAMPPNVTVLPAVDHAQLREIYSRASLCLFLPTVPEPAGRTPVEAALCGCPVEVNEMWSASSFGLPLDDAEATRAAIRAARFEFWRAVEGACS